MRLTRRGVIAAGAGAALSGPVSAHRLHMALTTLEWRPHRSALEVVHRLYAHDVSPVMRDRGYGGDLDEVRDRAQAALYVAERFFLANEAGEPIELTLVGAELEGKYFFVYQEVALAGPPAGLTLRVGALLEEFPGQVNTVNARLGDGLVRTLEFRFGDDPKSFSDDTPAEAGSGSAPPSGGH